MKIKKFYNDIINDIVSQKNSLSPTVLTWHGDEYVGFTAGSAARVMLKERSLLDFDKIAEMRLKGRPAFSLDKFFEGFVADEKHEGRRTGEMRDIPNGKIRQKRAVKLESKEHHTWVDEKYLNMYEDDCVFLVTGNIPKPVLVSRYGDPCGVIMPVRVKEEENAR